MAGKIKQSDVDEVKSRVNIADIIGEYVALKPASVGSLKGLCPFHGEKSPSFNVRPAQGFFKCFGCGEGGDVVKFLNLMEGLSFVESIEKLAASIGYQLTYEDGGGAQESGNRARILEANNAAAAYFASQLGSDEAATARDLLLKRGFDATAAQTFGLGYAPKGWNHLTDHLKALGFKPEELVNAGLASLGERGAFDKFRGRLIWPIRDSASAVIGFGARKLYDDDNGPKYLNTSDTPVYHKSQVLYGIDLAKRDITKQRRVVVVEGYTDVMACHLAGVTTAVATCGTAFGDDHIRILNRMLGNGGDTPAEVIFTFDPDAAGQKAAMRAFADSDKFSALTFVAVGPDGLDPSDLRTAQGDGAVVAMIENKRPLFEFAIKQKISNFDLGSLEGRIGAARAAAPVVAGIRDVALRPAYIREVAGWLNLDVNEVSSLVEIAAKQVRSDAVQSTRLEPSVESSQGQEVEASASEQSPAAPADFPPINLNDPITRVERQVIEVLLQLPQQYQPAELERLVRLGFSHPAHAALTRQLLEIRRADWAQDPIVGLMQRDLGPLASILQDAAAQSLPAVGAEAESRYARGVINRALVNVIAREKTELLALLRRLDADNQREQVAAVQKGLVDLEAERRKLQEI
jgi:DNA primase